MMEAIRTVAFTAFLFLFTITLLPVKVSAATTDWKEVVVTVRDVAGKPISGVEIELRAGKFDRDGYTFDDGSAHVEISTTHASYASLDATADGFCSVGMHWEGASGSVSIPDHIDLIMDRPAGISGTIVDENGQPLPGATVICDVEKKYPNSLEELSASWETVVADSDGKWSLPDVPEKVDSVSIDAYHKECMTSKNLIAPQPFDDLAGLKNGTAVYTLHRGTPVRFIIRGPDKHPVGNATVTFGAEYPSGNTYPKESADGDGIVQLGIAPGTEGIFTINAKGFAPELIRETIGKTAKTFEINLNAGKPLEGVLVDAGGDPVANANVYVQYWRGCQTLPVELCTTDEGKFSWPNAPDDDVVVGISSQSGEKLNVTVRAGKENKIQLAAPTTFKGTVVDAATNNPITEFNVNYGVQWSHDQAIDWRYDIFGQFELAMDGNTFEATFRQEDCMIAVRVNAEGYFPADSTAFKTGSKDPAFIFKLEKATPIQGIVRDSMGKPVKGATVFLALHRNPIALVNGNVQPDQPGSETIVETGVDGTFSMRRVKEAYLVGVVSDAGYAQVSDASLQKNPSISLTPWARIVGTVRLETKADAAAHVTGSTLGSPDGNAPQIIWNVDAVTDPQGNFALDRVNAATFFVGRTLELGNNYSTEVDNVTVLTKPGETSTIQIGGVGRPVVGHIAIPKELAVKGFVFAEGLLMPEKTSNTESKAFLPKPDGTFRIENIPEGTYTLSVQLKEFFQPDKGPPPAQLGAVTSKVTVPPVSGGVSDEPVDIGELHVIPPADTPTSRPNSH